MLIMIPYVLLIRRDVALPMASQVLAPSPVALFLLFELVLLGLLDLFGAAVGVFFDEEARGGCESAAGEGGAEVKAEGGGMEGAEEWHCEMLWV